MTSASYPTRAEVEAADDVEVLLRWNRFLGPPSNAEQVDVIKAVVARLAILRQQDSAAFTAASKRLGWD